MKHIRWMRAPDGGGSTGGSAPAADPVADPKPTGADPGQSAADPAKAQEPAKPAKEPTFDELMQNPAFKAEHDRRVKAGSEAAKAEAERLSKLSADERQKEEQARFNQERAQFEQERLENEATKQLATMSLPVEFAKQLVGKDATETLANVQAFGTAFNAAVEQAVNDRIKGTSPKVGKPETPDGYIDAKYKSNPYYGREI